jgi:hypothetical protein
MASSVGSCSRHNSRDRNQPDECILSIRLHCRCHRRTNRPRWLQQELEGFGGAVILDGSGKFLIPALWDMHVHIENPDRDFPMIVANGILGVRNRAGVAKDVFRWREDTASGTALGPQIVACGPLIDGPNPAHPEHAISVHNAAEGRQCTTECRKMRISQSQPEAQQLHLAFVGHVPGEIRIREASDAGQHSLEHGAPLSGGSTFEDEKIKEEMTGPDFMEEARQKNDFSIIPENIAKLSSPSLDYSQSG